LPDLDLNVVSPARLRNDGNPGSWNLRRWAGDKVYDTITTGFNPHASGGCPESDAIDIPMSFLNGKLRLIRSAYF